MFAALGAASSAIDLLKSLTSAGSSSTSTKTSGSKTGFGVASLDQLQTASTTFGGSSSSSGNLSTGTLSALLSAQSQTTSSSSSSTSRGGALNSLFGTLDSDSSGGISKTEFENALGAGGTNTAKADEVFGKLDTNGDGSVSLDELGAGLKSGKGHRHHAAKSSDDSQKQTDPLLQALDGATSTSATNSDGSTTTSLTYADGSKVTLTTPASSSASSTASSSYNFIEQAIQRQAQAISAKATSSLSVSV